MLAGELEQRDEGDDDDRRASPGVEQLLEEREAAPLQRAQHDRHVLANAQVLARDLVVLVELRALDDLEPGFAQVDRLDDRQPRRRRLFDGDVRAQEVAAARLPDVDPVDLRNAWIEIVKRARLNQHHLISREHLSVREHMSIVLRALQGRRFALFEDLFDATRGAPVVVVTFIALLELAREHLLEVTQAEAFAPIYVRLAYQAS